MDVNRSACACPTFGAHRLSPRGCMAHRYPGEELDPSDECVCNCHYEFEDGDDDGR